MKINKSLKIIFLFLAPLIGFSLFLSACSNNNSNEITKPSTSDHTLFESSGSVVEDVNLNKILPSESNLLITQTLIKSFILNSLISGKKNNIQIDDLNIVTVTPNNNNGTLNITYEIKKYWENNILIVIPKELTLVLNGFLKETIPTTFLDDKNKDITSNTKLSALSTNELNDNKILLQEFLFETQLTGNKDSLTLHDINISNFLNGNSEVGISTIQYDLIRYWTNRGITNVSKSFSITLTGFKKVKLTDEQILQEINYGGNLNGLKIDKFLPVINYLNLSNKTRLNILTDIELNKRLGLSPNFNTLKIEIKEGNQATQKLILLISGTYKNIAITNELITINDFYNSINNYNGRFDEFIRSIYISELNFNFDAFFNNLQIENDIAKWTTNDWIEKYLNKIIISKIPSNDVVIHFNLLDYYKDKIFDDIIFSNVIEAISSKSWSKLKIDVTYSNYQYEASTKTWTKINDNSSKQFSFPTDNRLEYRMPTEKDTIDWIAKNKVTFNTAITNTYYASYWYSLYKVTNDTEAINSTIIIDPDYKTKYFNNGSLSLSLDTISVGDLTGQMLISYKLIFNEFLRSTPAVIQTNTFKKLSTFIDANKEEQKNTIQVYDAESSSLYRNIRKSILADFTKQELQAMTLNATVDMKSGPVLFKGTNYYRLFNGDLTSPTDKLDTKYLDNINPMLFGKRISNSIDTDKNLFLLNGRRDNGSKFWINSILINVAETAKATLTKQSNAFVYKVPFTYVLGIEDPANSTIEINSYYYMSILYSALGLK